MIDFHIHSKISDGSETPSRLVELAKEKGLKAMALTDHDAVEGLDEARQKANDLGINFVNGIELSVAYGDKRLVHVIGLGFDPSDSVFKSIYTGFRESKEEKIRYVIKALGDMGIIIKQNDLYAYATGDWLDRQAIAKWLVANEVVENTTRAWIDVLDKVPYFDGELIKPVAAFHMIKAAGGKTFLAHYHKKIGLYGYTHEEKGNHLKALKEMGLDGIEGYYPTFSEEHHEELDGFINTYELDISGGSDYHGITRAHIEIGTGGGHFQVPDHIYTKQFQKK